MINKENILQTAHSLVRQYNLPLKIRGVEEGTEEVIIYFTADKKAGLREIAQELELQLNLPIKLERVKKSETGKIGEIDVLGKYPCCASFLRKCPFGGKCGCGYGLTKTRKQENKKTIVDEKPATQKHRTLRDTETQKKREKKKRKKVVRRLVIKR